MIPVIFGIVIYVENIDSWFWQIPQHDLPPSSMRPMISATIVEQPADVILKTTFFRCSLASIGPNCMSFLCLFGAPDYGLTL